MSQPSITLPQSTGQWFGPVKQLSAGAYTQCKIFKNFVKRQLNENTSDISLTL